MPGKVKVRVLAGRNLPVMDRANDTTDAFVEIRLGTVTQKTDVCRRSLNPQWNSDWFRFEVRPAVEDSTCWEVGERYDTTARDVSIKKHQMLVKVTNEGDLRLIVYIA